MALVPLLWAWRGAGPRRAALYGLVAGCAFYGVLVSWTWFFGPVAYVPFVLVLAAWWAALGAAAGQLACWRGRPLAAPAVAGLWVLTEAVSSRWPFGGFSWGEVGYAFHGMPVGRSLAAWGGVPLVGLLAVTVNGLVLSAGLALHGAKGRPRAALDGARLPLAGLATVVVLAVAAQVFLPDLRPTGRLRVALVQGNDKNRELTRAELDAHYLPRNHLRLAERIRRPVDLVVFPESSLDRDPRDDRELDRELAALSRRLGTTLLAGGNTEAPKDRIYNTTFTYRRGVRAGAVYRKRHLVPFGEFVPFRDALSFISALDQIPLDFAPGKRPLSVGVAGHPVGILICFESAFAGLARDYARHGAEALVVSTNNRSFRRSPNSAQHVALGQMRAAETGRPVIHAGISGRSALIDARGRVTARRGLFRPTLLEGEVRTTTGRTPYVDYGDWALAVAAVSVAGTMAAGRRAAGRRGRP